MSAASLTTGKAIATLAAIAGPTRLRLACGAVLALAGLVLCGQGIYIHAKAILAQHLLERAFDRSLATGEVVKPWAWFDSWPEARITVPRLGQDVIVLAQSSGQALAFGPGHVAGTPEAGEAGTAVYAAHRDTHFAFLGALVPGDEIEVMQRDGRGWRYRVTRSEVVRFDASGLDAHAGGHHLALATCWPLDGVLHGPERLVVRADLVEP